MEDLRGRVAVVTGGGSGIGFGIAGALAAAGARLIVADIEGAAAEAAAASFRSAGHPAIARRTDVTNADDLDSLAEATIEAFGAVHVLVNNAGVMTMGPLAEASEADWSWLFDVNVHGVVRGVRAFLPHLRANAPAHIVNTVSMAAVAPRLDGGMGIYTASKAAVLGYSEVLRAELEGDRGRRHGAVPRSGQHAPLGGGTEPPPPLRPAQVDEHARARPQAAARRGRRHGRRRDPA